MAKNDVQDVTRAFLNRLLDSADYQPLGLFICREEVDGEVVYVAVNNSTGEAYTEEFASHARAKRWLHGLHARNRFGEMLNADDE